MVNRGYRVWRAVDWSYLDFFWWFSTFPPTFWCKFRIFTHSWKIFTFRVSSNFRVFLGKVIMVEMVGNGPKIFFWPRGSNLAILSLEINFRAQWGRKPEEIWVFQKIEFGNGVFFNFRTRLLSNILEKPLIQFQIQRKVLVAKGELFSTYRLDSLICFFLVKKMLSSEGINSEKHCVTNLYAMANGFIMTKLILPKRHQGMSGYCPRPLWAM